jgi:pyrroloquinoline quinone (PQQ) biosynthesis protein C
MDFFAELDAVRERWNVLEHPFYTRWSAGELTQDELALYAGQYRQAVTGLAQAAANTAAAAQDPELRRGLERHAAEEAAHVALWDRFTAAVGGDAAAAPLAESSACAAAWSGDGERPLLESLVAMYAIESAQPAIAETKRDGLVAHYGFAPASDATAYFDLHATLDVEHAAHEHALIEPRLDDADRDALIAEAERVLRANWELLDGVERALGRAPELAAS